MLWACHVVGLFLPVVVRNWSAVRAELNESFAVGTFILSFLLMTYNYLWITASDKMPVALALLAAVGQSVYQISWKGFFMSRPANWLFFVTCGCAIAVQHLLLLPGIAMIGYMTPLQLPGAHQLPLVLLAAMLAFTVNALTVLV